MKTLLVIDMQNDFINGALGTKEAEAIVPFVKDKIKEYREAGNPVFLLMHFRCVAGYVASFFFQSIALPKASAFALRAFPYPGARRKRALCAALRAGYVIKAGRL